MEKSLAWVRDIDIEDLPDKDANLVYEVCGPDVFIASGKPCLPTPFT